MTEFIKGQCVKVVHVCDEPLSPYHYLKGQYGWYMHGTISGKPIHLVRFADGREIWVSLVEAVAV
jgi:nicotinamidase-related amidase